MEDKTVIKEYFEAVDSKLQKLLVSPIVKNTTEKILQKYPLREEQGSQLEIEISLVLLGMEVVSNFRANLVRELGITYDQALKLSLEVNKEIFDQVMTELKEMEVDILTAGEKPETNETAGKEELKEKEIAPKNTVLEKQVASNTLDRSIPDHEAMVKESGPHLHSQTVMPQNTTKTPPPIPKVAPAPQNIPSATEEEVQQFGTIIDRKLSQAMRGFGNTNGSDTNKAPSPQTSTTTSPGSQNRYKGPDPYREPIE